MPRDTCTAGKHMTQACVSSEEFPLKLAESHDFSAHFNQTLKASQALPKHPICPCCDVPMWLSKVRTKAKKVEYFYECKACDGYEPALVVIQLSHDHGPITGLIAKSAINVNATGER